MALKATVRKVTLSVADIDREYYADHCLTLAQHPSENDQRLMARLLAFALNASDRLAFTRGLSSDDEPELWERALTGDVRLWIELGLPVEERLRRACNRAERVRLYAYGDRTVPIWWQKHEGKLCQCSNLEVIQFPESGIQALSEMMARGMKLQCTVQEGEVGMGDGQSHVALEPVWLQGPAGPDGAT